MNYDNSVTMLLLVSVAVIFSAGEALAAKNKTAMVYGA
jgi:hypothetical protein